MEDGAVHLLLGDGVCRLVLAGDVDHATNGELVEAVNEALDLAIPVQVDARNVRFMDSSAVAMIAYLAQRSGSRPTMIQPPDVVLFLLEVTKIGEVVDITEDDPGFSPPGGR